MFVENFFYGLAVQIAFFPKTVSLLLYLLGIEIG